MAGVRAAELAAQRDTCACMHPCRKPHSARTPITRCPTVNMPLAQGMLPTWMDPLPWVFAHNSWSGPRRDAMVKTLVRSATKVRGAPPGGHPARTLARPTARTPCTPRRHLSVRLAARAPA